MSPHDAVAPAQHRREPAATEAETQAGIIRRTQLARLASGLVQEDIAALLGIDMQRYAKYEKRTVIQAWLMVRFCRAVNVDVEWLLTGVGHGPSLAVVSRTSGRQGRPPKILRSEAGRAASP